MGNNTTAGDIISPQLDFAKHVQVVENVLERAVVRSTVEKLVEPRLSCSLIAPSRILPAKLPHQAVLAKTPPIIAA